MTLFVIDCPKIWSWKSHAGYGKKSWNPLYKEREYVQYYLKKNYDSDILTCPVCIDYCYHVPIPKSFSLKKKTAAINHEIYPSHRCFDLTNATKFYEDCLKGIVIEDDCQVVKSTQKKIYSEHGGRVVISVHEINEF